MDVSTTGEVPLVAQLTKISGFANFHEGRVRDEGRGSAEAPTTR
jgi:hypothetical protein